MRMFFQKPTGYRRVSDSWKSRTKYKDKGSPVVKEKKEERFSHKRNFMMRREVAEGLLGEDSYFF